MKIKLKHVEISRPYYHGWVYSKVSAWRESIDTHLLRLHQVRSQNICSQYLFFVSLELCWNRRRNYSHPLINYPVLILKIVSRSWNLNTSFSPEFYSSVDSFLPPLFFFVRCIYNLQRQSSSGKYISNQMLNIFIFFLIRILWLVWLLVDVVDRCSVK